MMDCIIDIVRDAIISGKLKSATLLRIPTGTSLLHSPRLISFTAGTTFKQIYPFIDYSTGGSIDGMIAASDAVSGQDDSR